MVQILQHFPGQQVTIFLEIQDGYDGARADSLTMPTVDRIIFPGLTLASGYPSAMTQLDTGLYYANFTLPTGASSIGSYLVDVSYTNPINSVVNQAAYQIIVIAPFGNFGTTTG